jgi:DTW domain-containing protein YfiP
LAREICFSCNKAKAACVCSWVSEQDSIYPVLILQHDDEVSKPLGTAKLIAQGLKHAHIHTGVIFNQVECLNQLDQIGGHRPILLYPKLLKHSPYRIDLDLFTKHYSHLSREQVTNGLGLCERFSCEQLHSKQYFDSVIVLDGTWRNTRELLLANEWLSGLPTLQLVGAEKSNYTIRKAKEVGALATIEAVAQLLTTIDHQFNPQTLLLPFSKMIEYQVLRMGKTVFKQNYL